MTSITVRRAKNGQKQLQKIMRQFRGARKVKVGFPKGSDDEILDKAIYNEFGTEHIPARPFMRNGLRDGIPELNRVSRVVAGRVINGTLTANQALNQLGTTGVNLVQESITDLKSPPNAPSTVAQKGSANPLIDSGEMRGAVTHKVEP